VIDGRQEKRSLMFINKRRTVFIVILALLALASVSIAYASAPVRVTQDQTPGTPGSVNIGAAIAAELVPVQTLVGGAAGVTEAVFSPDNTLVAAASPDGIVRVWQVSDGALLYALEGHTAAVNSVAFSPDSALLASGSDDRSVRVWDLADGSEVRTIRTNLSGRALKVAFSPDGSTLAIGGHYCVVEVRRTFSWLLTRTISLPTCGIRQGGQADYMGMIYSTDGSQLVIGAGHASRGAGAITIWDTQAYIAPRLVKGYNFVIRTMALSPDGTTISVAQVGSSRVSLIRLADGAFTQTLEGHTFRVNSVAFSPEGLVLASGSQDGTTRLWGTRNSLLLRVLEDPNGAVTSVTFSSDGGMIATGSEKGDVTLWALSVP
jgi:WD40 repeat protein